MTDHDPNRAVFLTQSHANDVRVALDSVRDFLRSTSMPEAELPHLQEMANGTFLIIESYRFVPDILNYLKTVLHDKSALRREVIKVLRDACMGTPEGEDALVARACPLDDALQAVPLPAEVTTATSTTPRSKRRRPLLTLSLSKECRVRLDEIARRWGLSRSGAVDRMVREVQMPRETR